MFTRSFFRFGATLTASVVMTFALAQGCASEASDTSSTRTDDDGGGATTNMGGSGAGTTDGGMGGTALGGNGGEGGEEPFECGDDVSEANLENLPADLIVIVDNSDSMAFEAGQVKDQMNGLVGAITSTGIDAHLVIISEGSDNFFFDPLDTGVCLPAPLGSGDCPADENLPAYRHIEQRVESTNALQIAINTYDQWKTSLRPNATKTFLVISDDDSAMTAMDFTAALGALDPPITDFKFNAIVASESPISCAACALNCGGCTNPCCDQSLLCIPLSTDEGAVYEELQMQSGGVYGDLCEQNFTPAFNDMAQAVIEFTQINCSFDVPAPANGMLVPGETNVAFVPAPNATPQTIFNVPTANDCTINGGWYFDNNTNPTTITMCDATCNNVQQSTDGKVLVTYGCTTETVPN